MTVLFFLLSSFVGAVSSCASIEPPFSPLEVDQSLVVDTVSIVMKPYREWTPEESVKIREFGPLSFYHQSAAAYKDYAIFVRGGRSVMCLYSLKKKEVLYSLNLKGVNRNVYHCNQSSFGCEKYDPSDFFPLLYVSQRANASGRCFIEVYRIHPEYNEEGTEFASFGVELVQLIYLPRMSQDNSLGNANCAIDASKRVMYVYSRNNNTDDDNYGQCKITEFEIPDVHQKQVALEDSDIQSSFLLDISAVNMQGGCVNNGMLYIGQGVYSAGYIYLNVIDLEKKELVIRMDLMKEGVRWEPEGCFFYDGSVMISHTRAICRIDKFD